MLISIFVLLKEGQYGTSGTPFAQIHDHCQKNKLVLIIAAWGIQNCGNTTIYLNAHKNGAFITLVPNKFIHRALPGKRLFLMNLCLIMIIYTYRSCLDVFAECFAPRSKCTSSDRISPLQVLPLLKYIAQTGKVVSIDIAELSPSLDQEHRNRGWGR